MKDQPVWIRRFSTEEIGKLAADVATDGPLAGISFAVKDNIDLAGYPTTAACPALSEPVDRSATAVRRLMAAGAVPVGKTNLDQFATGLVGTRSPYGVCHSVASAAHVSGGSSSGSAVAVATGLVPLALGTDTAGSGRVPAAFNGIVGVKPTRGLVSTAGVFPACRSLDCVTTFTVTVAAARTALASLVGVDGNDHWSRAMPAVPPPFVAERMRVIAVPDRPLDLEPAHADAWEAAVASARQLAHVIEVDVTPFLAAADLLYAGPWLAERWAAVGHLLDLPGVDPTVRAVVRPGWRVSGAEVFAGFDRLAVLRRDTAAVWADADALLLPVTPSHPTLAEVAADPVGVNSGLGRFTNFVNLLDLCAVAVPAGQRSDGLPFGVQLIAPAFADGPLLELAARWCAEPAPESPTGSTVDSGWLELAVCGAHLSGLPLNPQLLRYGARLRYRARTAGGYRMFRLPGPGVPRPGLVHTGDGPGEGLAVEVWTMPEQAVGALLNTIPAPLGLGRIGLDDGRKVAGFMAGPEALGGTDITGYGGWRGYLNASG